MTHLNKIKSLSQQSTAENYTRPFIQLPFQLIFSHRDDIFSTRYRLDSAGPESISNPIDF
jgi:hypothetical protein